MKYRLFLTVPLVAHYSCELVIEAKDEQEAYEKYQAMSLVEIDERATDWEQHTDNAVADGEFDLFRVEEEFENEFEN